MPSALTLLVIMLACGAAGLYVALPGGRRKLRGLAVLLLAAGLGAFLGLAVPLVTGGSTMGWFIALALIVLFGSVRMITHPKPVYSAVYFILVVVAVTGLLVLMQAEFLAAALLIIYAGAILVTYVFVIMLAQQREPAAYDSEAREPFWGCLAGFALLAVIGGQLLSPPEVEAVAATAEQASGSVLRVGAVLMTNYVVSVQLGGVLLLAALVGAIAIARRKPADALSGETD